MAINGIMNNICFAAGEPFIKRGVFGIQYRIPFLMPFQVLGLFGPEAFAVLYRLFVKGLIIFNGGIINYFLGRMKYLLSHGIFFFFAHAFVSV